MQIVNQKRNVDTTGVQGSRRFEMAQTSHMMQILTSQYSNIPGSIVREYASNMIDGYVKLDKSVPFIKPRIHLPNTLEPYIEFMDFGCGMSFDTVWEIFPKMGISTKQGNNDEIGGFGLGAKTAFAYKSAEQWAVESRFNNEKMIFNAHWGEDNWPQFIHVVTVQTTEPNGVTVRIPVNPKDFHAFHREAAEFLEFFPLEVDITGIDPTFMIAKKEYILEGDDWKISEGHGNSRIVVGPVSYPISIETLFGKSISYYYSPTNAPFEEELLSKNSVTLHVPIGSVDIIPNREALMFTDRTKTKILTMIQKILVDSELRAAKEVEKSKTEWEAIIKLSQMWTVVPIRNGLKNVTWKGIQLDPTMGLWREVDSLMKIDSTIIIDKIENPHARSHVSIDGRQRKVIIHPSNDTVIYFNDLARGTHKRVSSDLRSRMDAHHGRNNPAGFKRGKYWTTKTFTAYIISGDSIDITTLNNLFGGFPVLLSSSLPKVVSTRTGKKINLKKFMDSYGSIYPTNTLADTTRPAIYVRTHLKNYIDFRSTTPSVVIRTAWDAKLIDREIPIYTIGRTDKHLEKTTGWVELKEYITKELIKKLKTFPSEILLKTKWQNSIYQEGFESCSRIIDGFSKTDFPVDSLPYQILKDYNWDIDATSSKYFFLANELQINIDIPLSYNPIDKATELDLKCPLLKLFQEGILTESNKELILNYIKQNI